MFLRYVFYFLLVAVFAFSSKVCAVEAYEVQFVGDLSPQLYELLNCTSELVALKSSPPATNAGLEHRAEADIKNFLKVLHSQAFYNATIKLDYNYKQCPVLVTISINTGPVYPLAGFSIVGATASECSDFPYDSICLYDIGVLLHVPATPKTILSAEEALLYVMARRGYPLATISEREVLADQQQQAIYVILHVDSGPQAYFGETTITGLCSVKEEFLRKKIAWCMGSRYNPCLVDRTHNVIEATGLFSSITITHADSITENNQLPMQIELKEARHRSIGWGLSYSTDWGPGVAAEWEHRNIFGMGEKLSFDADAWQAMQRVKLLYVKPDFIRPAQDFLLLAEALHDKTKGYHESALSFSGMIERQLDPHVRISYGAMYKYLKDTRSFQNGEYNLLKSPLYIRYSNVNNLLDPTYGATVLLRIIPSWQFLHKQFAYCINTLTSTFYYPLTCDERYVFAAKSTLGAIWGSSRRTIPISERFYEGSDNNMRGYRFLTVSPLGPDQKPIGGRSVMTYSMELRVKATENFGWVSFYDFGNVYSSIIPNLNKKILHSVGFGLRYLTPVGPLRLDFAVPLQRRRRLDHRFEVYVSIGQAF